jgi:pyruvate/2-oxoglutarate dehydrogenase complex dihydrolipoamide dehydrogenase (E3) component
MQATSPPEDAPQAPAGAPSEDITTDICVIGAGSGGLAVAAAAAAFGRKVVLIERHQMGGQSLNCGCIPSKALLAAGKRARAMRTASLFGIGSVEPEIDPRAVHDHIQGVIAALAPNAAAERFTGLGVRVIRAAARFTSKSTVEAGERRIKARRFVIATGSTPLVPAIPGLDTVPYLTNETIFGAQERFQHLIVIGAGAIALELAQAYARLGSRVTVLAADKPLAHEDPELASAVLAQLAAEGVDVHAGAQIDRVEGGLGRVRAHVSVGGESRVVEGSHLLIAAGRTPAISDLGLEAAGIRHDDTGIKVNAKLKTSNRRVFAIGDVTGAAPLADVAQCQADIVIRRTLFGQSAKFDATLIPRVTFTDPELAHVGLSEAEAVKAAGKINVLRWPYRENDRAQVERQTEGHIKVITAASGRVLGASIVGAAAAELIQIWALAIAQKLPIKAMIGWISPYPTLSEINKRVAYRYYGTRPGNPKLRRMIGFLSRFS